MQIAIFVLLLLVLVAIIVLILRKGKDGSQDLIVQLNGNLSQQIQDIRKEVSKTAENNRKEIEEKLININKESIQGITIPPIVPEKVLPELIDG